MKAILLVVHAAPGILGWAGVAEYQLYLDAHCTVPDTAPLSGWNITEVLAKLSEPGCLCSRGSFKEGIPFVSKTCRSGDNCAVPASPTTSFTCTDSECESCSRVLQTEYPEGYFLLTDVYNQEGTCTAVVQDGTLKYSRMAIKSTSRGGIMDTDTAAVLWTETFCPRCAGDGSHEAETCPTGTECRCEGERVQSSWSSPGSGAGERSLLFGSQDAGCSTRACIITREINWARVEKVLAGEMTVAEAREATAAAAAA